MEYIALLDESGNQVDQTHWFLYGGLVLGASSATELHSRIRGIRRRAGYTRRLPLKWSFPRGPGSKGVTRESHSQAVSELLEGCDQLDARLYAVLTPSLVTVRTRRDHRNVKFGASYVLGSIQRLMLGENSHCVAVIDRPPGTGGLSIFDEVISEGIPAGIAGKRRTRFYDRVIVTSISSISSSRLLSAIDVALGALNFGLHCSPGNLQRATDFYGRVRPLLLRATPPISAQHYGPWGYGLRIRPMQLRPQFHGQARSAAQKIASLGERFPPLDTRLGFVGKWLSP